MAQHQVRRLPVVDEENRLVGVVSQADVALEAKDKSVGEMLAEISKPPQGPRTPNCNHFVINATNPR
jgi:CBS-domain-containing membrane protein